MPFRIAWQGRIGSSTATSSTGVGWLTAAVCAMVSPLHGSKGAAPSGCMSEHFWSALYQCGLLLSPPECPMQQTGQPEAVQENGLSPMASQGPALFSSTQSGP